MVEGIWLSGFRGLWFRVLLDFGGSRSCYRGLKKLAKALGYIVVKGLGFWGF